MFNKTAMISLKTGKQWYTISRGRTIKRELSSTSVSKKENGIKWYKMIELYYIYVYM